MVLWGPRGIDAVTMKLTLISNSHPNEDILEDYAFERLPAEETVRFEEHLLVCEKCQAALEQTEATIELIRTAAASYLSHEVPRIGVRQNRLRWNAGAAAVLLLTCLTALLSWRTTPVEPKTVQLDAYRGTSSVVPAGQPLDLRIDLTEVPPASGYRVEVVEATGNRVWFGGTPATITKGLQPGRYWVRLSTDTGEPLREYGILAR